MIMILDEQYKEWLKEQIFSNVDEDKLKYELIEELKFLSFMTVREYTLYQKWTEIQEKYPAKKSTGCLTIFFDHPLSMLIYPELENIKNNIWIPESPDDHLKLEPTLIWTDKDKKLMNIWTTLRVFIHSQKNSPNIGKCLYFIVVDNVTNKYLGVIAISGDFMDLTARDKYIGWDRETKTNKKMISHSCIMNTCVPTQPLGFNYVGGKLLALLAISNIVRDSWDSRYKDTLVSMTTTSLYGSFSQYQNLKYWKKMGHSSGSVRYEPSKKVINKMKEWLRINHTRKYWEWYVAKKESGIPLKRDYRQRSFDFTYNKLGIDKKLISTNHERGIYFCPFFTNSTEYLRMEIEDKDLTDRFNYNIDNLVDIWKKYAKKRLTSVIDNKKYNTNILFYDDMIGKSWDEIREKYIK